MSFHVQAWSVNSALCAAVVPKHECCQIQLTAVLDEPAVIAVITWGLSDRYTWLSHKQARQDGRAVRPLPLDADMRRKEAWKAIARAFKQATPV